MALGGADHLGLVLRLGAGRPVRGPADGGRPAPRVRQHPGAGADRRVDLEDVDLPVGRTWRVRAAGEEGGAGQGRARGRRLVRGRAGADRRLVTGSLRRLRSNRLEGHRTSHTFRRSSAILAAFVLVPSMRAMLYSWTASAFRRCPPNVRRTRPS